ncbi:MAG: cupin domain-containing protein [Bacteroidota bacterium]
MSAKEIIELMGLIRHPEGGWFREFYKSGEVFDAGHLPERFHGPRNFSTSIYFLLTKGEKSKFHRLRQDEIWHFYAGSAAELYNISYSGNIRKQILGIGLKDNEQPQALVPAGSWMAAASLGGYTLLGCTVAPGFEFDDLDLAERDKLIGEYPHLKKIITDFT